MNESFIQTLDRFCFDPNFLFNVNKLNQVTPMSHFFCFFLFIIEKLNTYVSTEAAHLQQNRTWEKKKKIPTFTSENEKVFFSTLKTQNFHFTDKSKLKLRVTQWPEAWLKKVTACRFQLKKIYKKIKYKEAEFLLKTVLRLKWSSITSKNSASQCKVTAGVCVEFLLWHIKIK